MKVSLTLHPFLLNNVEVLMWQMSGMLLKLLLKS